MSRSMQSRWLTTICILTIVFVFNDARRVLAQRVTEAVGHRGPECLVVDNFFADEVWAKVGERTCLKCHNTKGDASESKFLLRDTVRDRAERADALRHNRAAFQRLAVAMNDGKSQLLSKIRR